MKNILTAVLLLASTQAMALGPVFEEGSNARPILICDVATTRTDGSSLSANEIQMIELTILNETTTVSEIFNTGSNCDNTFVTDNMLRGQYKVTAVTIDTGNRRSVSSDPFYFLLIPAIAPPNAPTNLRFQ